MHAGLLNVLHDSGDMGVAAVGQRIHIDLDRVLEETVEQQRMLLVRLDVGLEVGGEVVDRVTDLHRPAAEDVGRADQQREADFLGDHGGFLGGKRGAIGRMLDAELAQQGTKATTILGQVDRVDRGPE